MLNCTNLPALTASKLGGFKGNHLYLTTKYFALPVVAAAVLLTASTEARAGAILNGALAGTVGQLTVNGSLANWTGGGKEGNFGSPTTPPVFLFAPGAGQTGEAGDAFMGTVSFYGVTTSPDGGNFVAADGDPSWGGSLKQTVTGLTVGDVYSLTFNWAGAQQQGFGGNTTEHWQVSLGTDTLSTSTVNTPSQAFAGWQTAALSFTASSTSELLTFLAVGSPSGQPPWLLIDGINLSDTTSATPEPGSVLLVSTGVCLLVGFSRRRFRATKIRVAE